MPRQYNRRPKDPKQPTTPLVEEPANILSQEDLFNDRLLEIEDQIVSLFACGASVAIIRKRVPSFSEQEIAETIRRKLSIGQVPGDLLPGMQIYGFNDDLRVLSDLINDRSIPSREKLLAVKTRVDARNALITFLQSQNLLFNADSGLPPRLPEGQAPSELEISQTRRNFDALKDPTERQKYIEALSQGKEYVPTVIITNQDDDSELTNEDTNDAEEDSSD